MKYRNKINSKLFSEHQSIITKTRKSTQPTKKLDWRVTFHVKKLLRFPELSIDTDIEWNRSVASKKTNKFVTANSEVDFNRTKYDKTKSRPIGIRYKISFQRYMINRKIFFVGTIYVRFLCFQCICKRKVPLLYLIGYQQLRS